MAMLLYLPMACPCFLPRQPFADSQCASAFPRPLGSAWRGECRSPLAPSHEALDDRHMLNCCNMGYSAGRCGNFPAGNADSVRFSISSDTGPAIYVDWVHERDHLPAAHGRAEYHRNTGQFAPALNSEILTAQALAYVTTYLRRREAAR